MLWTGIQTSIAGRGGRVKYRGFRAPDLSLGNPSFQQQLKAVAGPRNQRYLRPDLRKGTGP